MSLSRLAWQPGCQPPAAAALLVPPRPLCGRHQKRQRQQNLLAPTRHLALRCAARLTSSRDSIDEEQVEQQQNGRAAAAPNGRRRAPASPPGVLQQAQRLRSPDQAAAAAGGGVPPPAGAACEQQLPWAAGGPPRQLSIAQLQKLTELHVEDAYALGVVESGPELAACLGTDLRDGLREGPVRLAGVGGGDGVALLGR